MLRRRLYVVEAEVGTDRSTHPTVVEYAIQFLFKRKNPKSAATETAKRLSGYENLFLGPGVSTIDPGKLEDAVWDRLADFVIQSIKKTKSGMEHFALDGAIANFNQSSSVRKKLKSIVEKKVGHDVFKNDTVK